MGSPRSIRLLLLCALLVSGCGTNFLISQTQTPTIKATSTPTPIPIPTPTKDRKFSTNMVVIPAGEFQMGCKVVNLEDRCERVEQPLHTVYLDAYIIDKYEVTNNQYAQCVAAGACDPPLIINAASRSPYFEDPIYKDFPVVWVSWHNANDFCNWAGKRLPTEAEWEKAARGGDNRRGYPWGNSNPTCTLLNFKDTEGYCVGDTSQVGRYPDGASPYGVMDMAGNVWEWVSDWYSVSYYHTYPANGWPTNPQGPEEGIFKVLRGGSWRIDADGVRSSFRLGGSPDHGYDNDGFRCAAKP